MDLDRDGIGEFGTLGELTGGAGLRTATDASTRGERVKPPILSPALAGVTRAGLVTKSGYAFRLFLPGAQGGAVREERSDSLYRRGECIDCVGKPRDAPCGRCGELAAPFTGAVDVDGAETRWCAYAWPVAHGNSGNRAFFVDQGGEVRWTANEKGRYSGVEFGPAWDAAMPVPGRDRAPTDSKLREHRGRDGGVWTRTN